jgi:PAS domain S-box-containing protein
MTMAAHDRGGEDGVTLRFAPRPSAASADAARARPERTHMRLGEIWRAILGRYEGERHRLLVELCPDALFIHCRGRFVFANAAGLSLLGADLAEQVLGRRVLDFVHPDFHELVRAQVVGTDAAAPASPCHEVLRRLDGKLVDAETSAVAFTLSGERAVGVVARDVTQRRRIEGERARLTESERTARTAAEAAVARLTAIQSVTDSALAQLGLDELLRELLSRVRILLRADTATVLLTTSDGAGLEVRASDGMRLAEEGVVPFGRGIAGRIAADRATLAVEDVRAHDAFRGAVREDLRSLLGTPLLVDGRAIGVLHVGTATRRTFTEDETRLLQLVADRTAMSIDRARLFDEIRESQRALEALSSRLFEVQEEERRRLARELHDDVGQRLTALKFLIDRVEANSASVQARQVVDETLSRVRDLSTGLAPPMLEDLGLLHALLWHVERFQAQTRIKVSFRHSHLNRRFPPEVELSAFRIVQEALTNTARHAGKATARLNVWANEQVLGVEVEDDGVGFDPHRAVASVGLAGMRERVRLAGGRFTLRSAPGEGTALSAVFPLTPEPAPEPEPVEER